ncbi:hypothetical protein PANA5342_2336 [Pantoea ananatis LMG 5342]|nr:hypothetical protein PANA5342_2336 [Pantoea ananatis LMG 5342]
MPVTSPPLMTIPILILTSFWLNASEAIVSGYQPGICK